MQPWRSPVCLEQTHGHWSKPEPIPPTASDQEAAAEAAPIASLFDIAFGVSVTSDYISRGITLSGNDPAIQGYIEPSIGMAYLNI